MVVTTETDRPHWVQTVLIGRRPKRTAVRIVVLVVVCFVWFRFVLLPIRVQGMSMMPTYTENRVNFVNRVAYLFHKPMRGDVVAIRTSGISIMYMKRIIGLPGETVEFHAGQAVIDGVILDEPYLKYNCDWELPPKLLGADEWYVVGDNRDNSNDSRMWGPLQRKFIYGKFVSKYYSAS